MALMSLPACRAPSLAFTAASRLSCLICCVVSADLSLVDCVSQPSAMKASREKARAIRIVIWSGIAEATWLVANGGSEDDGSWKDQRPYGTKSPDQENPTSATYPNIPDASSCS